MTPEDFAAILLQVQNLGPGPKPLLYGRPVFLRLNAYLPPIVKPTRYWDIPTQQWVDL